MDRIIGEINGDEPGPLIILMGILHGNETAGIKAIDQVFHKIDQENLRVRGKIIGIRGNIQAYKLRKRFIDYDLNRAWTEEQVSRLRDNGKSLFFREDHEMADLIQFFDRVFEGNGQEDKICVDLHTTSSDNGNFIIVPESFSNHPVIKALKLPVILDLEKHIKGTLLSYLVQRNILSFAFEGGLMGSEVAIKLHVAGIWEILLASGAIQDDPVKEIEIGALLQTFAYDLPYKLRVKYHYWITEEDDFNMKPGFINFQRVEKGEEIATDRNGRIYAPMDGMIFMPLYQRTGNDGFFIVQEVDALN
jgi:succinylglutamate desuccinylase